MATKPYKALLERVQNGTPEQISPNNQKLLEEFLTIEHPGDVLFTKWSFPPILKKARGSRVWDVDGKEYIDCIEGMSSMNLGHGDTRISEAVAREYAELDNWFDFPTEQRLKLAQRLIDLTPGKFAKRVRFGLSGSDAVENAIRLARYYTKKQTIICFYGGYHGQSVGTMGLTGSGGMHRWYNPMPAADHCIERFPYAYCYRCPYGKEEGKCDFECVKAIDTLMASCQTSMGNPMGGVNNVAAMIVEPCQSSAGYITPPVGFMKKLRELADKYGFLLIADEIQTGMGRTGTMLCCEQSGVEPDMILVGKGLGAGFPISAVVGRAEIFEDTAPGFICSTYAGNNISCTVGNKVLDIYEEDHILEKCRAAGEHAGKKLDELLARHEVIGSYCRRGIYFGIEFVTDRATKEPGTKDAAIFVDKLKDAGVLAQLNGYYNNRISFIPPLNISLEDIDLIFQAVDSVLTEMGK